MATVEYEILQLRQRVSKLERQVAYLLDHLRLQYAEDPHQGVSPEILDLLRQGRKIQAIKLFREETGTGLREAKEFIDSLDV